MFTGNKMRIALHAHALLAAVQPAPKALGKQDIEADLRRQYLGRAFQCASCGFGPIDHFACSDLAAHHREAVGTAQINNACPRCDWFSEELEHWPKWDGTVPPEAREKNVASEGSSGASLMTSAAADMVLRICYSARALWSTGAGSDVQSLCQKLANWETLTTADGVDHPVQLLLAMAVADDLPEESLGTVPLLTVLNEVCARRARNELRQNAGTEEPAVMSAARKRVASFLGVSAASAPQTRPLEESEPKRHAVEEACCSDYTLDTSSFDFKEWVKEGLQPCLPALIFVKRLRAVLHSRGGGWSKLATDMERGPDAYADVIDVLQKKPKTTESLASFIGVEHKKDVQRVLATIAAQAFLCNSSQLRRTVSSGGSLQEPLGDVRDSTTTRTLCVQLRMTVYEERVAAKMREWSKLGASLTYQRARVADLEEYSHLCGTHVHGLDKQTFWGLWHAATGEKARAFLGTANQGFWSKHGSNYQH